MDVVELREFYASPLGNATRRLISAKLKPRLGSLSDACVLGMGFATPYLDGGIADARATLALSIGQGKVRCSRP
jgi:hypothetical protein